LWIEASTPLTIRRRSGDVRLLPGRPVDLPEAEALKLLAKAPGKVREATGSVDIEEMKLTWALAPGDRIEWQRAGTAQQGLVDFLHCDADGTMWAFCTVPGGSWTAVNMKFAKGSGHD
jgi:hypothetical protein